MKKKNFLKLFLALLIPVFVLISCGEDDGPAAPDLAINVDPVVSQSKPGETVDFTIEVDGDLESLSLNNDQIETFTQEFNFSIFFSGTWYTSVTFSGTSTSAQLNSTHVKLNA